MLEGLLQAVRDTPEDDAPRLVLADWLEENSGPDGLARAEFIRAGCRAHALPDDDPERQRLFGRVEELEDLHGYTWSANLGGGWRRGLFHADIYTDEHLEALLAARHVWPWVEGVDIRGDSGVGPDAHPALLEKLLGSPLFRWVCWLSVYGPFGDREANLVARCPRAGNIRELWLLDVTFGPEGYKSLLTSPHLTGLTLLRLATYRGDAGWVPAVPETPLPPNLSRLYLQSASLLSSGATPLASAPALGQLRELNLRGNGITAAGAKALASAAHLRPPLDLILYDNPLGDEGVQALLDGGVLPSGPVLDLSCVGLGLAGVQAVADCPALAGVRELRLQANQLGAEAVAVLTQSPRLSGLTILNLGYNRIDDEAARLLAESPHLGNLVTLDLKRNRIGDRGVQALARSPQLPNLAELELRENQIGREGAIALAATDLPLVELSIPGVPLGPDGFRDFLSALRLPALRELNLSQTGLDDEAIALLARSGLLGRLRKLRLDGNGLTGKGVRILAESPDVDGLQFLDISNNWGMDREGVNALHARLGRRVYTGWEYE